MQLLRYIKPYRTQFIFGSAAKLAEAMLELYLPLLMAKILDIGIPAGDRDFIVSSGVQLLLFALAGLALAVTCQYCAAVTSQGSGTLIRGALIDKISAFSYRELDRFGTSTLINRVTSDVNYVQQAVAMTMRLVTRAPFICIGAVVMSVGIDKGLSLLFALLIPVLGLVLYLLMRLTAPLYRLVQKKLDSFALVVRESLSGVRIIRAFARTGSEEHRAHRAAADLSDEYIHVSNLSALMNPATSIILNLGLIAILYFGAKRVFGGMIAQGDLLALTTYATKILYALIIIANLVVLFTKASASAGRISEVLTVEPTVVDTVVSLPSPVPGAAAIAFEEVSFSYSGGQDSLTDVSFAMEKGKVLGIVGVTGSGKSTIINLIQRFYDPDRGKVLLEGVSVRDYPQIALRERIGVVPQKNTLFSGTIADNLRWGKENATEEEIIRALKTAQCWEFVCGLSEGIHSVIHEGGKNFSGGQRQRLTIARAVVKKPSVLILDDSLSALDYKTDLALRRALQQVLQDTTIIIISQRISSVTGAHSILVLENGAVQGLGTHAELLEGCDAYREIYRSQIQSKGGAASA